MITKIEMQYMEAVIQMNRRQRNPEANWEQRRYEIAKSALLVAPMISDGHERKTAEQIAKNAVEIADALVMELINTEK